MDGKPGLFSGLSLRRPSPASGTIAHPLLGANPSSSPESDGDARADALPYKPRQRVASTSPITPTPTLPAPSPTSARTAPESPSLSAAPPAPPAITTTSTTFAPEESATATGRLQLQSLKAAAQRLGLTNGSMGMGMVDAIFEKGARARADGDWAELLKVLTSGKAILLLPSSPASSLPMTPQTLRDHIAFLSPALPGPTAVLVTLSGLIGSLSGTTVTFESSVPTDSPLLHAVRNEAHRAGVLGRLRPTVAYSPTSTPSPLSYPSFVLSTESASLPFPPLGRGAPEKRTDPAKRYAFMSLFGSSANTPRSTGALSPIDRPSSPNASGRSSPRPSVLSLSEDEHADGYTVTAYILDRPVRYAEVHKALVKAVRSAVRAELDGLPDRVIDKVLRFVVGAVCPVSGSADQALLKSHHHGLGGGDSDVPLDFSDPNSAGERSQDFMEGVYDDLVHHFQSEGPKKWENSEAHESYIEDEATEGTERVEAVVCRLLHNRIFSPINSDDSRHDEALASRVAALNLMDLSLDHLGLITRPPDEAEPGTIARGLAALVDRIGRELQKLSTTACLTPKDKADVLVHAHKIAVDGLARLPPIELRPEGEPYVPEGLDTITEMAETPGTVPAPGTVTEMTETPTLRVSDPDGEGTELTEAATLRAEPEEMETDGSSSPSDTGEAKSEAEKPPAATSTTDPSPQPATPRPTSGADLILPLIIFAVVKANPAQLASQLMYLRRYRSAICLAGEASYAIVNLTAVVEFLEHVQLADLGLGDSRVISVDDLSPIGLGDMSDDSIADARSRLARRLTVSDLAGSAAEGAGKVLGVVDSGISALRGFLPSAPPVPEEGKERQPQTRPRQTSSFSIASVTASVASIAAAASTAAARTRSRASSEAARPLGQELVEVPPGHYSDEEDEHRPTPTRARSIVSVSSMMRDSSHERERERQGDREGVGARLSSIGARLAEGSPAPGSPLSASASPLPGPGPADRPDLPPGSAKEKDGFFASLSKRRVPKSPSFGHLALEDSAPVERFMSCEVGDLKMSEVGALLKDYRRLAGVVARLQNAQQHA